ncbi:MAG: flagellar motor switch protein FliN [Gammaproteobacteria bacterium]
MTDDVVDEDQDASTDADWGDALAEQAEGEAGDADWGDALAEQAEGEAGDADWGDALAEQAESEAVEASPAGLQQLTSDASEHVEGNLDQILDIPVTLGVEIGSTKIAIRNLLQLNQGSVVELDRLAGEPLDVMVNGTLVAHGEVVVVNEKFGIRLTDVISAQDRVKKLR